MAVAAPLLVATAAMASAQPTPVTATGTQRIAGADRFETSIAISQQSFAPSHETVFVASGQDFPDALAGGAAAAKRVAPLLLTRSDRTPEGIAAEVKRLRPSKIIILGGTKAVGTTSASALSAIAPTQRIGGDDRYATAAAVSKANFPSAQTVYIASGLGFADALSGGPAAAKESAPLLLTSSGALHDATRTELERLKPTTVKILGGTSALSDKVRNEIRAAVPTATVTRYSGNDRYATAANIARSLWPNGSRTVFYASGTQFPDGLSATPAAAINQAPLLLSTSSCMPQATADTIASLKPTLRLFVGGAKAVSTSTSACGTKPKPPATPQPPPPPATPPRPTKDYDCKDFATWREAQDMFDKYFPAYGDIFRLDADDDRIACETLPGAPS